MHTFGSALEAELSKTSGKNAAETDRKKTAVLGKWLELSDAQRFRSPGAPSR